MQIGAHFFKKVVLLSLYYLALPGASLHSDTAEVELEDLAAADSGEAFTATHSQSPTQQPAQQKKATLLQPINIAYEDPLLLLDSMVVKQTNTLLYYVPLIQTIAFMVDYGRLIWSVLFTTERTYEGGIAVLCRNNMQLAGDLGYSYLGPTKKTYGNTSRYTIAGMYGRIGVDYFVKFSLRDNLYGGLRYGKGNFINRTVPETSNSPAISKNVTANWFELIVGSERSLLKNNNFYGGLIIRLGRLYNFDKFTPVTHYVIPGYGMTANKTVFGITLYLKYSLSFLKKQFIFN